MKLSDDLRKWRAERPDEWTMDRFIRMAENLENAPKNTTDNSDYAKCSNELLDYITDNICDNGVSKKEIKAILKKHFA